MAKLSENWLTDGLIDYEYKTYVLLAYLKQVGKSFASHKLYPSLNELVLHYNNLMAVKEGRNILYQGFPQRITEADFKELKISYQKVIEDDELMKCIAEVVAFAQPKFEYVLEDAKSIYAHIVEHIEIEPIGISPISTDEGYLFLSQFHSSEVLIYQYQVSVFQNVQEKYRGINLRFLELVRRGFGRTYEHIKLELTKKYQNLPNPATFLFAAKLPFPLKEAFLPISQQLLMRHLAKGVA